MLTFDEEISEPPNMQTGSDANERLLESHGDEELDEQEEEDLSSEMEDEEECTPESTLLYHMEKKYMCDELESRLNTGGATSAEMSDSIIDIFGTSPCWLASRRGLELVVLDHNAISRVGDASKFASHAKHISQLDLGWNQLGSWGEIANLLSSLPSLRVLNLQHNPVEPVIKWRVGKKRRFSGGRAPRQRASPTNAPTILPLPISSRLSVLILNGVQLPVATLRHFLSTMPSLNELHLSGNRLLLTTLLGNGGSDEGDGARRIVSDSVTHLHLNDIGAREWRLLASAIAMLFPSTNHLSVVDNPLQRVEPCGAEGLTLKSLNASHTQLADWDSIEAMEGVEELRVRHVALFGSYSDEERFNLTVARISSLRSLNGSLITPQQREMSERFFVRYYSPAATPTSSPPPAYERLVAKHGQLEPLVKIDFTPKRTAKVWIRYQRDVIAIDGGEDSPSDGGCGEKREQVRLRLSSNVQQLMSYAAKVSGIPTGRMRIFHFDAASSAAASGCGPTELRLPQQKLQSLHVEDGDEFFVQEKPATMTPTKSRPRQVPCRRS